MKKVKVLILEDQAQRIKWFSTKFGGFCEIYWAATYEQFAYYLLATHPDLIILDNDLGSSGETINFLKSEEEVLGWPASQLLPECDYMIWSQNLIAAPQIKNTLLDILGSCEADSIHFLPYEPADDSYYYYKVYRKLYDIYTNINR